MKVVQSLTAGVFVFTTSLASYMNFESSHVHPIALTPSGDRLLAVNTPDALLEVFAVQPDGSLVAERAIPVGLEPVTVVARTETEAWVVNNLSDSVSIVDLDLGVVIRTLRTGDEPTDVVFANGKAFVAISTEDAVEVFYLANLNGSDRISLFGRDTRALARSPDGQKVYAVMLKSGNQTTVINANVVHGLPIPVNEEAFATLGLAPFDCLPPGAPPPPPLPDGITRSPLLPDPPFSGQPPNSVIVGWDNATSKFLDHAGQNWTPCVRYRLPDRDLFIIDTVSLAVTDVPHVGTTLFEVSVNPVTGKIYVPNTDARNRIPFEHARSLRGHFVDNRLSVVDPASGNALNVIELNSHIKRATDPATNIAERMASISQPGMMTWRSDGSVAYLTAIGSRKVFRVDGGCEIETCIFGPDRKTPAAVVVGDGPTGVALREATLPENERLYVLNRISHSIAIVKTQTMDKLSEIPLHDPSSDATRTGRRFLYDAILTSGHGDSACASCHPSGDMDGLAWELGNPEGQFRSYDLPNDNIRFVLNLGVETCSPAEFGCAEHEGHDPQKGPMVTRTLRGMLEPLHWRGDRPTFNDFNQTFVDLLGTANLAAANETPAGLPDESMQQFKDFIMDVRFPPNPHRRVDDTTPCGLRAVDPNCQLLLPGAEAYGNPTEGEKLFKTGQDFIGFRSCTACHQPPFGTFGGALGGVVPTEPTSAEATALHHGTLGIEFPVPHSDVEVPDLRNLYEKFGPVAYDNQIADAKGGFGYSHDGSILSVIRFLSSNTFTFEPDAFEQQRRDVTSFLFSFPTGTKPAAGHQLTVPAGQPPTGTATDEALLVTLLGLGDLNDANRHCELVASALAAGGQLRTYYWSGGLWHADLAADAPVSTQILRVSAESPITFTCSTLGSGPRLGGDRDEDGALNLDDCAPADAGTLAQPETVSGVVLAKIGMTSLAWVDQSDTAGSSTAYDILSGTLSLLRATGFGDATCVAGGLDLPAFADTRPDPPDSDGYYYLVRASNPCGVAELGSGREELLALACP